MYIYNVTLFKEIPFYIIKKVSHTIIVLYPIQLRFTS